MADIYADVIIGSPTVTVTGGGQTERRVGIVMELDTALMPLREKWMITKASGGNVSKIEIKPNSPNIAEWLDLPLNQEIAIDISECADYDALVRITRVGIESTATVYLHGKAVE